MGCGSSGCCAGCCAASKTSQHGISMADLTRGGSTADGDVTGRGPKGEEVLRCRLTVAMLFWRAFAVPLSAREPRPTLGAVQARRNMTPTYGSQRSRENLHRLAALC